MFNSDITTENWLDPAELAVALWLFVSPFLLGFFDIQSASLVMMGVSLVVIFTSLLGLSNHLPWEEWINVTLAVVLIASPWLFNFSSVTAATINALVCGGLLVVLSVAALRVDYSKLAKAQLSERLHPASATRDTTHRQVRN